MIEKNVYNADRIARTYRVNPSPQEVIK